MDFHKYDSVASILISEAFVFAYGPLVSEGLDEAVLRVLRIASGTIGSLYSGETDQYGYLKGDQSELLGDGYTGLIHDNLSKCMLMYCMVHNLAEVHLNAIMVHQAVLKARLSTTGNNCGFSSSASSLLSAATADYNEGGLVDLPVDIGMFQQFCAGEGNLATSVISKCLYPVGFVQFMDNHEKHKATVEAEIKATHMFRLMDLNGEDGRWIPLLVVFCGSRCIHVEIYAPTVNQRGEFRIARVKVISMWDTSLTSIWRLVHIIVQWHRLCREFLKSKRPALVECAPGAFMDPRLILHRHQTVLFLPNGRVRKAFDYRRPRNDEPPGRRPSHLPYQYSTLRGLTLLAEWESELSDETYVLIEYDRVEGTHCPVTVRHLLSLVAAVRTVHLQGIVHGDIRLANVIFSGGGEGSQATLLDFDLGGPGGQRMYPEGYQTDIEDGERHPEAREWVFLQREHDMHALAWICLQFWPREGGETAVRQWVDWVEGWRHDPSPPEPSQTVYPQLGTLRQWLVGLCPGSPLQACTGLLEGVILPTAGQH